MLSVLFPITKRYVHYSSSPYFLFIFDPNCIIKIYSFMCLLQNIIINIITRNSQATKSHLLRCINIFYWNFCHFCLHRFSISQFSVFSRTNSRIIKNFIIFLSFFNLSGNIFYGFLFTSSVSIKISHSSYVFESSTASE